MIESIKDLKLDDLKEDDENFWTLLDERLKEHLGINSVEIKEALSKAIVESAEELSLELPNIAPHGNYEKMLEDNESMANFLKDEASKPEHMVLYSIHEDDKMKQLLKFVIVNKAVDNGESLTGFVYVSKAGVIRHAFAQIES